jgi:hypothetical protein
VSKTLFVDLVLSLNNAGITSDQVPAKIEGVAFGPDIRQAGKTVHTLWIGNDNDFLETTTDAINNTIPNPNQFFVFGFTDADLGGSKFVPQQVQGFDE